MSTQAESHASPEAGAGRAAPRRGLHLDVSSLLWRYAIPLLLVLVLAVFWSLRPSTFGTLNNIRAVLSLEAVTVVVALAGALVLLVGEFDVSIANNTALVAALVVGLQAEQHVPWGLAIAIAMGVSLVAGLLNGFLVVKLHMSSFVATLGTYSLLEGAWIWYLGDETLVPTQPLPSLFTDIGRGALGGLDAPFFVAIVLAVIGWYVLAYLPTGRRLYAVGGNRQAARLSGIRVDRLLIGAFVVGGLVAGIAGVLLGAEYGDASPGAGSELLFPAFAAVFLGATTIQPGRYNVPGIVVSAYALAFMIAGLQQLGGVWSEQWVSPTFSGAALVIGVALSTWAFAARERGSKRQQLRRLLVGSTRTDVSTGSEAMTAGERHDAPD